MQTTRCALALALVVGAAPALASDALASRPQTQRTVQVTWGAIKGDIIHPGKGSRPPVATPGRPWEPPAATSRSAGEPDTFLRVLGRRALSWLRPAAGHDARDGAEGR